MTPYPYFESQKVVVTLQRASVIAQSLVHREMEKLIKKVEMSESVYFIHDPSCLGKLIEWFEKEVEKDHAEKNKQK
jgi:hypothetical protein